MMGNLKDIVLQRMEFGLIRYVNCISVSRLSKLRALDP